MNALLKNSKLISLHFKNKAMRLDENILYCLDSFALTRYILKRRQSFYLILEEKTSKGIYFILKYKIKKIKHRRRLICTETIYNKYQTPQATAVDWFYGDLQSIFENKENMVGKDGAVKISKIRVQQMLTHKDGQLRKFIKERLNA